MKRNGKVNGIRDMRTIKLYSKIGQSGAVDYFVSEKTSNRMCRLKTTKATIENIASMPESNAIELARQLLDAAKRIGNANYYEAKA